VVIKGSTRGNPSALAKHLDNGTENERVTLIGIHGLAARDLDGALIEMDALGAGLKTQRTLYHASINVGPKDRMTEEQWQISSAALREKLDLAGQPYVEIEHQKHGRVHRHFVISRTDVENMRAIRADHNYRKHEEVARALERQFGHEKVQGAHVERDGKKRPDRTPSYAEMQQAKRTGLDPKQAKAFITGLWQGADSGKAFAAALDSHGWMMAKGDRRDFVLIDPQGETHSLTRRVDTKAAEVKARIADLDREQLPSVDDARVRQLAREAAREARQAHDLAAARATHEAQQAATGRIDDTRSVFTAAADRTTEPGAFDRDAANREWEVKLAEAAINAEAQKGRQQPGDDAGRETRAGGHEPSGGPGNQPERAVHAKATEGEDMRPLGKTAGEIRAAWTLSRSAEQLEEALAARGITLAQVSREEADQSLRTAEFAKEVGNFARVVKEGEIVAVNAHGDVHRLDQRTTGDVHPEIETRFPQIDRGGLLSVTDAKEVMQEAARAAWREERQAEREKERPATVIETVIADALTNTMTGTDFAAALDKAGVSITRANETDVKALDALRQDAALAGIVAHTEAEPITARHFDTLQPGDFAAVNAQGDVFRLNPHKLDLDDIEQRLADTQTRMPSVVEARAQNEINRESTADFWAELRAQNMDAQTARADAFEARQEARDTVAAGERGVNETLDATEDALDAGTRAASGGISRLAKAVENILGGIFSFFGGGETKLTPIQRELAAKADDELAEARQAAAVLHDKEAAQDWHVFNRDRDARQEELERQTGHRERPGDREREREREWP
jgi:hypothetical protein